MDEDKNKENVKGVVVICLPPPDNPSEGKQIFVFTENLRPNSTLLNERELDDQLPLHTAPSSSDEVPSRHSEDDPIPLHSAPAPPVLSDAPRLRPLKSKRLVSVLFAAVVAYFIWQYAPSQVETDEKLEDSQEENILLFSIHSKSLAQVTSNISSMAAVSPYPSNYGSIPPMTLNLLERDVVRNSMINSQAQATDSQQTSTTIFPLKGNVYPDGLYYVSARFGNPTQEYFLDMDTGSDLTWLQCDAPCTSCAKGPHALYRPKKINLVDCMEPSCTTIQAGSRFNCNKGYGQCNYDIKYADRGYSLGVLVHDHLAMILSNRTVGFTKVVFGCAYNQQGSLAKSPSITDGVLGLSSSAISLPSQLARKGLTRNIFGHCISADSTGGGYLFFGDKLVPSQGMSWAPFLGKPETNNYVLSMENVFVGDTKIDMGQQVAREVIFDSGTSYTYLVSSVYSAIVSTIQKGLIGTPLKLDKTDNTLPVCWKGDSPFSSLEYVRQYFKPVILEFKSSSGWLSKSSRMQFSPEGYLIKNSKGNVCLGILDGIVLGRNAPSIIGDISMQGILMVYDNENQRLGWMKTDCRKVPRSAVVSPSI